MNAIQRAVLRWLPKDGDYLPICGRFYRDRLGMPYPLLRYPGWFARCCEWEATVISSIYRMCGRTF